MKNKVLLLPALAMMLSFCTTAYAYHKFAWSDAATSWSGNYYCNSGSLSSPPGCHYSDETDYSSGYSKDIMPASYDCKSTNTTSHCSSSSGCGSCYSSSFLMVQKDNFTGTTPSPFTMITAMLELSNAAGSVGAREDDLWQLYTGTRSWDYHTDYSDSPPDDDSGAVWSFDTDILYGCRGTDSQNGSTSLPPTSAVPPDYVSNWNSSGYSDLFKSKITCAAHYTESGPVIGSPGVWPYNWGWLLTPGPTIYSPASANPFVNVVQYSTPLSHVGDQAHATLPAQQFFPLEYPYFLIQP